MLVVKLVVVIVVNFAMNKTGFRVMKEEIISQERELRSLFYFFCADHWVQWQ